MAYIRVNHVITCLLISNTWYINGINMHGIDTVGSIPYIKSFDKHNFVCKLLFQLTKIGVSISVIYHKITLNSWKVYEWFIYASVTLISLVQIMACHLAGTSHYPNQCWNIINLTLRNKLQWNVYRNSCIFIQENECTNLAWGKAAILSRPWYVKHCWILSIKTVQQPFHSKVQSSMTYHKQSSNHINYALDLNNTTSILSYRGGGLLWVFLRQKIYKRRTPCVFWHQMFGDDGVFMRKATALSCKHVIICTHLTYLENPHQFHP